MKLLLKYKAWVLSVVLGVFTLLVYNTDLMKKNGSRELASIENCEEVDTLPEASSNPSDKCFYEISIARSDGKASIKIINGNKIQILTRALQDMGYGDSPTQSEIKNYFMSAVQSRATSISVDGGDSCKGKPKPCTPTRSDELSVNTDEGFSEKASTDQDSDGEEEAETTNDGTPEGILKSEFNDVLNSAAGACFTLSDYNRLNIQIDGFNRTVDREIDKAEEYLKEFRTRLTLINTKYAENPIKTKDCHKISEAKKTSKDSTEDVDPSLDAKEQWSHYQKEILPKLREELASSGSLDGVAGLEKLAKSNESVDKAVGIEVQAFTIAAGIRANISAIKLGRGAPGVNEAEINALERKNAELFAKLTSLTSSDGELASPVASSAVTYWSDHFSKGLGELDRDGQGVSRVGDILDSDSGTSVSSTGSTTNTNQNVSPQAPIAPLAADAGNLDQFLVSVRSNYRNVRLALDGTRNTTNQKTRTSGRARTNQRQQAPNNRNLAVPGDNGNTGPRSIQ